MVETVILNKLGANSLRQNGNEIDMISDGVPIEIKYQEKDRKYFPEKGFVSEIEMLLKKPLFQYKNGITKFIFHTLLYNIKNNQN